MRMHDLINQLIPKAQPQNKLQSVYRKILTNNKRQLPKDEVSLALIKNPQERNLKEHQLIEEHALKFSYFQKYRNNQGAIKYQQLCRKLYLRVFFPGEQIIAQGTYGTEFFVLTEGLISIINHEPKNFEAHEQVEFQFRKLQEQNKNCIPQYDNPELFDPIEINQLEAGSAVGEMALFQNTITSAAVKAKTKCTFVCLSKADVLIFVCILKKFLMFSAKEEFQELQKKIAIIRNLPFFEDWSNTDLRNISPNFKTLIYQKGNFLFHEGDKMLGLYVICQGDVKIIKNLTVRQPLNSNPLFNQQTEIPKQICLCLLQYPSVLYDESSNYKFSAVCESHYVELLFITKSDLDKRFERQKNSQFTLQNLTQKQNKWRYTQEKLLKSLLLKEPQVEGSQVVNTEEMMKYLNFNSQLIPQTKITQSPSKAGARISLKEARFMSLDFLSAKKVLDSPAIDEKDFQQKDSKLKILKQNKLKNSILSKFVNLDPIQRAQNLGLGSSNKTLRDKLRREKNEREKFMSKELIMNGDQSLKTEKNVAQNRDPPLQIFHSLREKIKTEHPAGQVEILNLEQQTLTEQENELDSAKSQNRVKTVISDNWFRLTPKMSRNNQTRSCLIQQPEKCCIYQSKQFRIFLTNKSNEIELPMSQLSQKRSVRTVNQQVQSKQTQEKPHKLF